MPVAAQEAKVTHFSPDKFIDAMRAAKMTPFQLSCEMGASHEAIARWMAGLASPKPGYAQYAADVLGVDIDDLYE